jgi:hypothetical protein
LRRQVMRRVVDNVLQFCKLSGAQQTVRAGARFRDSRCRVVRRKGGRARRRKDAGEGRREGAASRGRVPS